MRDPLTTVRSLAMEMADQMTPIGDLLGLLPVISQGMIEADRDTANGLDRLCLLIREQLQEVERTRSQIVEVASASA